MNYAVNQDRVTDLKIYVYIRKGDSRFLLKKRLLF